MHKSFYLDASWWGLRDGYRGSAGPMRRRTWRFLVASEVALALVPLVFWRSA